MADPDFAGVAAALADDGVARLVAYARHETPTGDAPALNALADVLDERYRELGAQTERVAQETGDHLVARWGDVDAPHVLLLGHHGDRLPCRAGGPARGRAQQALSATYTSCACRHRFAGVVRRSGAFEQTSLGLDR